MRRILAALTLPLVFAPLAFATPQTENLQGQLIVRLKKGAQISSLTQLTAKDASVELLVPALNLYLIKATDANQVQSLALQLSKHDSVKYVQEDHLVKLRTSVSPNDPDFQRLWNMKNSESSADISATQAWQFGVGGRNLHGEDIVIAIVDSGIDASHPDLVDNMWRNAGEIPDNDIDDDGNGYVDDVFGWNAFTDSGAVIGGRHGTHVAGIAGARGGNSNQVTGVNWDVKIMNIPGASGTTSTVAKAYGYVLEQKRLWIETQGQKGANVVVTNSSFGIDMADCTSTRYSVWNDLYEAMGQVGILSAVATANQNVDVDAKGDVPSGCLSDYIISVTNTDNKDMKSKYAGYGAQSIDLGAPGDNILSTLPGGKLGSLSGTSMATPHVAGAVAFLHSVASSHFTSQVKEDPAGSALELKRIMLEKVDPNESLSGKTVTGGRLNLFKAAEAMTTY